MEKNMETVGILEIIEGFEGVGGGICAVPYT